MTGWLYNTWNCMASVLLVEMYSTFTFLWNVALSQCSATIFFNIWFDSEGCNPEKLKPSTFNYLGNFAYSLLCSGRGCSEILRGNFSWQGFQVALQIRKCSLLLEVNGIIAWLGKDFELKQYHFKKSDWFTDHICEWFLRWCRGAIEARYCGWFHFGGILSWMIQTSGLGFALSLQSVAGS